MSPEPVRYRGFHHVQLAMPPGQEDVADAFYSGVLGLRRVPKPPELETRGGCWFRGDGVEVHLGVEDQFHPARKAHPAFLVSDLDELEGRLTDAEAEVDRDVALAGFRRIHAFDPFGNRLEFLERATAP
jgi:catechol 2,3-dioxygenase-like lactoylglutathione lyase family enzyme